MVAPPKSTVIGGTVPSLSRRVSWSPDGAHPASTSIAELLADLLHLAQSPWTPRFKEDSRVSGIAPPPVSSYSRR